MSKTDVVVIGAGHNGLVCAAYLAKAGYKITVVEQRPDIGGCTRTIDFPGASGWRTNTCADVDIFFHNTPVPRDLELHTYGFELLQRDVVYFAPFADGTSLFIWPETARTAEAISLFSLHDANAYVDYMAFWTEAYRRLERIELMAPPSNRELAAALGGDQWAEDFLQFLVTPPDVLARDQFESPQMQGIMAWQTALYGLPPDQPGASLGMGHLAGCVLNGITRPRGGTGAICAALRACLEAHGGAVITGNGARRIVVNDGWATAVELADATAIEANVAVVSAIDAKRVFLQLIQENVLPPEDKRAVERISVNNVGLLRVSLALSGLPRFDDRYGTDDRFVRDSTQASIMLETDSWDSIQGPWNVVRDGELPETANNMWIGIPTAMDGSLARPGHHLISFAEYVPYRLKRGSWEERKNEAAEHVIHSWCKYAPGTRDLITGVWVQTPDDLHHETGNLNSNAFHIDQTFHQMFGMRPTTRLSQYRTPVAGLYLSGSGVHPGGGITGLPGRNTAMAILEDLGHGAAFAAGATTASHG